MKTVTLIIVMCLAVTIADFPAEDSVETRIEQITRTAGVILRTARSVRSALIRSLLTTLTGDRKPQEIL